ncbi:MAG: spore maturation protein [Candidatus Sumerlaeaceae bacterium]
MKEFVELINSWVIPLIFLFIIAYGYARRVKVYEVFVEGAKEGFNVGVMIIPYLVVILCAIAIFRASGAMDMLARAIAYFLPPAVVPSDVILLALVKPLSGSAARGVMLDIFARYGVDSLPGFMASVIQGSTETTFYVVAVYFGAIGVKNPRHTIAAGLTGEFTGIVVSIILAHVYFATR